jgi:iron complex outermembrane recepter protein
MNKTCERRIAPPRNASRLRERGILLLSGALVLLIGSSEQNARAQPGAAQALPPVVVEQPQAKRRQAAPSQTRSARTQRAARSRNAAAPPPAANAVAASPAAGGETATGPVQGFVATRSATGTKTDTPLREVPQSISVIPRDQMAAQGVSTLNDALRYTAGVNSELFGVDTRGFGVQLRGFTTFGDIIYKDGLQLKSPYFATYLALDPFGAERLEVLRGPASVLYGQNDPGGIINYVSKRPSDRAAHEVELLGGSFNHFEGRFDSTGPINQDKTLLYRVTGLWRDSDTQVDHVGKDRVFIQPSLTWRPNIDTNVTVMGHYQQDKTGWGLQFLPAYGTIFTNPNGQIPTSRFTGEPRFDKYDLTTYSIGYLFEHRLNDIWTVRQNARYAHLDNQQQGVFGLGFNVVDPLNPSNPANFRQLNRYGDFGFSNLDGFALDNQAQAKFVTGPLAHTLLMGVDGQYNKFSDQGGFTNDLSPIDLFNPVYGEVVTPLGLYQDTKQTQKQLGIYAHDQIKFGKLALALGGRHDWANTDTVDQLSGTTTAQRDSAFTGRAGLVYLFDNGLSPYVSYSESFLPNLGTNYFSEPFAPETGRQYEAGVKYAPPGWKASLNLAAFDLCKQNVLTRDPDPTHGGAQIQSGEICSRGFEAEGVAEPLPGLRLKAAYTYWDVRFTKDTDNQGKTPYGVPEHKAALWGDYTIQNGHFTGVGFGGGVRYIGSTWGDNENTFRVPEATVFDALLSYERSGLRFAVNASNLFDRTYAASCSGIGYCYYAEGRKVVASVRYRW